MSIFIRKRTRLFVVISISLFVLLTATLLILYLTIGHNFNKQIQPPVDPSLFDKDTILSLEQIEQDKDEIIKRVENTHPYLAIKEVPGYEVAKLHFKDADVTTASDMYFAVAKYLAIFDDLHTRTINLFNTIVELGIPYYVENDKLMMYPLGKENPAFELYAVNKVPYKDIFVPYASLENPNSLTLWVDCLFYADFLKRAGIEWENRHLTLTYKDTDGNLFDVSHPLLDYLVESDEEDYDYFEAKLIDDDVLYIRASLFFDDGSFDDCLSFIENSIKSGINKVIIDVRGNRGGSDSYGRKILETLGFEYSSMGFIIRYSQATASYRGTWRKSGYKNTQPFKYRSENPHNIELKVFCDEESVSAAVSGLAAICRYSDLGAIIGRMPGQNANFCGNIIFFQLPHSKVVYCLPISYSYFERDGQIAPDFLTPDIEVPANANFFEYVRWDQTLTLHSMPRLYHHLYNLFKNKI